MSFLTLKGKYNSLGISLVLLSIFSLSVDADVLKSEGDDQDISVESISNLSGKDRVYSNYIIGSGDRLYIEFFGLPEFSQIYAIGPTGSIYLPEIGAINVEGLSIQGLKRKLTEDYAEVITSPQFDIQIVGYRPVNAFVLGEVRKPGRYTISGSTDESYAFTKKVYPSIVTDKAEAFEQSLKTNSFPTLFDAIRASGGITEKSDLTNIQLTRKNPLDQGGGYIRTSLNIFPELIGEMITESQNIKILDGDIIKLSRSKELIMQQMRSAMKSNINPSQILVFISGQSEDRGSRVIPSGSSLNQLIASSGGKKIFSGNVEFIRFSNDGSVERRVFGHKPNAGEGTYQNPILIDGDIVHIRRSLIGYTNEAITTISKPAIGLLGLYNIYDLIAD